MLNRWPSRELLDDGPCSTQRPSQAKARKLFLALDGKAEAGRFPKPCQSHPEKKLLPEQEL
jgi:hypothetical protein